MEKTIQNETQCDDWRSLKVSAVFAVRVTYYWLNRFGVQVAVFTEG
jgi:hypothetical protein